MFTKEELEGNWLEWSRIESGELREKWERYSKNKASQEGLGYFLEFIKELEAVFYTTNTFLYISKELSNLIFQKLRNIADFFPDSPELNSHMGLLSLKIEFSVLQHKINQLRLNQKEPLDGSFPAKFLAPIGYPDKQPWRFFRDHPKWVNISSTLLIGFIFHLADKNLINFEEKKDRLIITAVQVLAAVSFSLINFATLARHADNEDIKYLERELSHVEDRIKEVSFLEDFRQIAKFNGV